MSLKLYLMRKYTQAISFRTTSNVALDLPLSVSKLILSKPSKSTKSVVMEGVSEFIFCTIIKKM